MSTNFIKIAGQPSEFEIVKLLGKGVSGMVLVVRNVTNSEESALKVIFLSCASKRASNLQNYIREIALF